MLKKNKRKVIVSSLVILLPMVAGIILWKVLPDVMTTHWGAGGNADGFGGKVFVVFALPVMLLALHLFALWVTSMDQKQKEQSPKALGMIFWIVPVISLFANGMVYCAALGKGMHTAWFIPVLMGVLFILMGNYMPKVKQNSTLGIKISWALRNEENWNKTHRFGGKVMVAGGFLLLVSAFFPFGVSFTVLILVIAAIALVPTLYSYSIYKQHQKQGIAYTAPTKSKAEKISGRILAITLPLIFLGVAVTMFTGDIAVSCEEDALTIEATYWSDLEVAYSEIGSIEYRTALDVGMRTNGFASAKLAMGIFENEEFGAYTLYAYAGAEEFAVLTSGEKTLVIGMKDAKETKTIYDAVLSKIGESE